MDDIKELVVSKDKSSLQWKHQGHPLEAQISDVDQILEDTSAGYIVILSEANGALPTKLTIISAGTAQASSIDRPDSFNYYYLSRHPELGVSVVCISEKPVEGWRDWHFGINYESKQLYRHCPAY